MSELLLDRPEINPLDSSMGSVEFSAPTPDKLLTTNVFKAMEINQLASFVGEEAQLFATHEQYVEKAKRAQLTRFVKQSTAIKAEYAEPKFEDITASIDDEVTEIEPKVADKFDQIARTSLAELVTLTDEIIASNDTESLEHIYRIEELPVVEDKKGEIEEEVIEIAPKEVVLSKPVALEMVTAPLESSVEPSNTIAKKTKETVKAPKKITRKLKFATAGVIGGLMAIPIGNYVEELTKTDVVTAEQIDTTTTPTTTSLETSAVQAELTIAPTDRSDPTIPEQTSTSIESVPTTEVPRNLTLLESVSNGERTLEEIAGNNVGFLNIDGVCLDEVNISVTNAADPKLNPEIMNGFDWSLLNGVQEGDYEAARSVLNPLYKTVIDETPQEACLVPFESEFVPRWESRSAGSARVRQQFEMAKNMTPQADIHPYSALPGETGVTYIQGHRTTYSAPFMNLDGLTPGSTASFSDGYNNYNYKFVGFETVNPDINVPNEILNRQTFGKNMLIVSTCDEGSDVRLMAIFEEQI